MQRLLFILLPSLLLACAPPQPEPSRIIAEGVITSIQKDGFIVKDKSHFSFFEADDAAMLTRLKELKKGEKITILGKKQGSDYIPEEIILKSGKHISLN